MPYSAGSFVVRAFRMPRRLRLVPFLRLFVAVSVTFALAEGCGPVSSDVPLSASTDGGAGDGATAGGDGAGSGYETWDASACAPGDVQTFQPGPYVPASKLVGACLSGDISTLYEACFSPSANVSTCTAFQQKSKESAACYSCVLTPSTASSYGPIINYTEFIAANVAGCIELVSQGVLACAKPAQALSECELAACEANCPVRDASSLTAFQGCTTQAKSGGCQAYDAAAACFTSELEAGSLSVCDPSEFRTFFDLVVPLFCGQEDAGLPTPSPMRDASSD